MSQPPAVLVCPRLSFIFLVKFIQLCFKLGQFDLLIEKASSVKDAESSEQGRIGVAVNVRRYSRIAFRVFFYCKFAIIVSRGAVVWNWMRLGIVFLHCLLTSLSSRLSLILDRLLEKTLNILRGVSHKFRTGRWTSAAAVSMIYMFAILSAQEPTWI